MDPATLHGLNYPNNFLASLPTLTQAPSTSHQHTPIRRLTAPQFSDVHLKYVTTHAPDHVLFPFLHGLEGNNEAQNQFFASSGAVCLQPSQIENRDPASLPYVPQLPNYRGLVWVAADDLDSSSHPRPYDPDTYAYMDTLYSDSEADDAYSTSSASTTSDDDDFDDAEVASIDGRHPAPHHEPYVGFGEVPMDLDLEVEMEMDVDATISGERGITALRGNEGEHMHPVKERTKVPTSDPITVSPTPTSPSARTPSLSSSTPSSLVSTSTDNTHVAPSSTAYPPIPLSPPPAPPSPQSYPILTSSFRPRELVKESTGGLDLAASPNIGYEVERFGPGAATGSPIHSHRKQAASSGEWEFVEPKVPDGISLRNFGIQAPIYATISDIVVYSPQGNTVASISLAQKFKQAIEKKYQQRLERLRSVNPDAPASEDFGLVNYNVFVLDATPDEMRNHLEHLVSRAEDISVPHSHTDGTDAHAHGDVPDSPVSPDGSPSESIATPGLDKAEQGFCEEVGDAKEKKKTMRTLRANTISFAQREKDEMRDLTRASEIITFFPLPSSSKAAEEEQEPEREEETEEISGSSTATFWDPTVGQIFLGNSNDVPMPVESPLFSRRNARQRGNSNSNNQVDHSQCSTDGSSSSEMCSCEDEEDWDWSGNDPAQGFGYDVCIECDDLAPFPSVMQMKKAEEHVRGMEQAWVERCLRKYAAPPTDEEDAVDVVQLPPRPPPNPNAVIHLPFPSSVTFTPSLLPFLNWLEGLVRPQQPVEVHIHPPKKSQEGKGKGVVGRRGSVAVMGNGGNAFMPSSLPPPSAFPSSFLPSEASSSSSGAYQRTRSTSATQISPSSSAPVPHTLSSSPSSFPSLRQPPSPPTVPSQQSLTRPLKVLVYSADGYTESSSLALCLLMAFKSLSLPEAYLELQVEKRRSFFVYGGEVGSLRRVESRLEKERNATMGLGSWGSGGHKAPTAVERRPSFGSASPSAYSFFGHPSAIQTMQESEPKSAHPLSKDARVWFNDPRFDGSFPSRVLPFLYLGNLNHASNAYMLHALGITHVVSVGECALVPPPHHYAGTPPSTSYGTCPTPEAYHQYVPGGPSSLWIEEREGRIKVLDIKGVCDDGIDTLEPQLAPICEWIDRARAGGGKVLVHCRVGVSRSATVTIAYVMQYLNVPLVDAYLVVRSRRLSVLIQPNMRLLYNLVAWELRLAMKRVEEAGVEGERKREERLKKELSRCLNWPYLAKEVHALNEKYLR
ncbi:hypothetical protein EUX98_g2692 [Antrodiella citrinella]|uniref:Uncharacterized protein n=1 Tax=Antrodiella citrinella TaxID=2447956 RepID=A0A4S4MYD4_9APHY|nr:hypothetical protein EUX98_g2692 [Antrodiella citrinella]